MSAHTLAASRFCFDAFELDTRVGELRKHGIKLRVQGQPLHVLAALLQRPGDLVTHDQLRGEIWPGDTFVDFDHSLHNAIARLREALGDSAVNPRYIETLPRRGYRFIGQVGEIVINGPKPPASVEETIEIDNPPNSCGTPKAVLVLTLMLLGAIVLATSMVRRVSYQAETSENRPLRSLAVLPLDNLSGDASQEYLADGMTDELITDLAKTSSLRVISRRSMMQYKGTKKPLPEIARELNVETVVEGSVARSGKTVRIRVQLLRALSDRHLWAEIYEGDLGDALRLQRDVAQAVAQRVRSEINSQPFETSDRRGNAFADAFSIHDARAVLEADSLRSSAGPSGACTYATLFPPLPSGVRCRVRVPI